MLWLLGAPQGDLCLCWPASAVPQTPIHRCLKRQNLPGPIANTLWHLPDAQPLFDYAILNKKVQHSVDMCRCCVLLQVLRMRQAMF